MKDVQEFVYAQPCSVSVETSIDTDSKGNKKPSIKIKMEEKIERTRTDDIYSVATEMIAKQKEMIVKYLKELNTAINGNE